MPRKTERDLTGERFERLTVLGQTDLRVMPNGRRRRLWLCRCDCGNTCEKLSSVLQRGVKSCGCYRGSVEHSAAISAAKRKHGHNLTNSGTYRSWAGMRHRCRCTEHRMCITHYVDRGITIDPRWDDFANFLEDMGERPEGHSIDRINPDGGYHPDNCRWANVMTQARNRKTTSLLTYEGQTKTIPEWAAELGITRGALWGRIKRNWPLERALSTTNTRSRYWSSASSGL